MNKYGLETCLDAHLTTSLIALVAETSELRKETMMQMIDAISDAHTPEGFERLMEYS